ncbi:Lipase [Gryllus bimaculatus]|nr:Lipase [Gryllus bimaculatus]
MGASATHSELLLLLLLLLAAAAANQLCRTTQLQEDAVLTCPELITKYGYPVETHEVTTDDGYILTLFRIPYGRDSATKTANPKPAYVQHGLLSSSDDWIIAGPDKAFGYILADAGYDVWLGNARGNKWSRRHVSLDPEKAAFWDFSWHEMGIYDLPAVIDYILATTGTKQLHYVGHSMGTTMFYVMGSERPEYNAKIRGAFTMAPVAFQANSKTPFIKTLSAAGKQLETMLPVLMAHFPSGASTKNFLHYAQSIRSGKFRQYDYGSIKNLKKYGSLKPPAYNLNKITAPVALHYADNDWLAVPKDVAKLHAKLPNLIGKFRVPFSKFNHMDFIIAIDANELLYDLVIRLMNRY